MIKQGLLEKVNDFEHKGQLIPASRLGYRVTSRFIRLYAGRVFDNPNKVFDEMILQPERQDLDAFADGVLYISEAHQRVAKLYFEDGSIDLACPPLRKLLHIMANGDFEGQGLDSDAIRQEFTVESMLESEWYRDRLRTRQARDTKLWKRHVEYLEKFLSCEENQADAVALNAEARLELARLEFAKVQTGEYLEDLRGYLGADPLKK